MTAFWTVADPEPPGSTVLAPIVRMLGVVAFVMDPTETIVTGRHTLLAVFPLTRS